MELLLATGNAGKAREFEQMLGGDFVVRALTHAVKETGKTFAENAIMKAIALSSQDRHLLVVADDSGLEVDSLGGAPGILSARYAESDADKVAKLLRELADERDRRARFRCVIALARDGALLATFEGAVEGVIVDLARGKNGFGYDPVFRPNEFELTFAELPPEVKNGISHRARAVEKLRRFLETLRD